MNPTIWIIESGEPYEAMTFVSAFATRELARKAFFEYFDDKTRASVHETINYISGRDAMDYRVRVREVPLHS